MRSGKERRERREREVEGGWVGKGREEGREEGKEKVREMGGRGREGGGEVVEGRGREG